MRQFPIHQQTRYGTILKNKYDKSVGESFKVIPSQGCERDYFGAFFSEIN